MEGSSPRAALRELLRRGTEGRRGLDDLTRQVWQRRSRLQRDNRLDGTLQEVRELLARALEAERTALANEDSDDARFREMQLDALPSDTGGAVRELDSYDWRSAEAREAYQEIRDLLGREMLDQRFAGHEAGDAERHARRRRADPGDARRPELPAREPRAGAEHRSSSSPSSWPKHGEFFPENPQNTDELVDLLAQRAAAAQRMLNSMSGAAARRADGAVAAGLRRPAPGPGARPSSTRSCRACGRGRTGRRRAASAARTRWAWARPPGRWRSWAGSTRWPSSCRSPTRARRWRTSTSTRWRPSSASRPASTPVRWPSWSASCDRQGLFERMPDGTLRLAPKALRRLGESALRDVVDRLGSRRGERETRRSGAAGEADGRDPAVGVRRHRGLARAPHPDQRRRCAAPPATRAGWTSPTSRSSRPSSAAGRRWRCASTRRGRWSRTGAGCR